MKNGYFYLLIILLLILIIITFNTNPVIVKKTVVFIYNHIDNSQNSNVAIENVCGNGNVIGDNNFVTNTVPCPQFA